MSRRVSRVLTTAATFVALVALVVVGTLIAQFGSLTSRSVSELTADRGGRLAPGRSAEVAELRDQVTALQSTLDSIHLDEARLRAAAGLAATDSSTILRRFFRRPPSFLRARPRRDAADVAFLRDSLAHSDTSALRIFAQRANATADSLTDFAGGVAKGLRSLTTQAERARRSEPAFSLSLNRATWDSAAVESRTDAGIAVRVLRETRLLAAQNGVVRSVTESSQDVWEVLLQNADSGLVRIRARGRALVNTGERLIRQQPVFVVDSMGILERLRIEWLPAATIIP